MKMNYNKEGVMQGRANQMKAKETPNTFATQDSASVVKGTAKLDRNTRMAGQEGERLMAMMNDPIEAERTKKWMNMFGLSNQGSEFNQAKMMGGMPPA